MRPQWEQVEALAAKQIDSLRVSLDACDDLKTLYRVQGKISAWRQLLGLPSKLDSELQEAKPPNG